MYYDFLERMNFAKRKSVEKIVCFALCIILSTVFSVWFFCIIDRTPATFEDYEELHTRIVAISENPDELLNNKGNISIYDDTIVYDIENKECKMTAKYTRDYKLIEYSQADKSSSLIAAILFSVILFCISFAVFLFASYVIVFVGESITIGIILLVKKIKQIRKKSELDKAV